MNWRKFIWLLLDNADKYFLIAGMAFLLFYVFFKSKFHHKKIQPKFPKLHDYGREILFSTLSVIIFSFPPLFLLYTDSIRLHTTFYKNIDDHGRLYFVCAFPVMILLHDTYFYWMHRLLHHRSLFRTLHLLHHRSHNPSPWAAYAFHPLEAVMEAFIFVIFLFTIPVHTIHLILFFVFSLLYNVYGHLGFELYPKGFNRHWFGKWMNTSVAHNMHHKYFRGN
ncbi:MAG TPA: sterol desaturase family protein, partial [Flavisolibacter sp.]|nr:sterol desaturase family protein [Flavisolibacter sp.]